MRFWLKFLLVVLFGSAGFSLKFLVELLAKLVAAGGLLAILHLSVGVLWGFPFGSVGSIALEVYDELIDCALDVVQPYIHELIGWIFPDLDLADYWKKVTVLTALYMSRSVVNAYSSEYVFVDRRGAKIHWRGDKQCAGWRAIWGLLLALGAGVGVGVLKVPESANALNDIQILDLAAGAYLFVAVPVLAVAFFQIGNGLFQAFARFDLERYRRKEIKTTIGIILGYSRSAAERVIDVLVAPRVPVGLFFNAPLWIAGAVVFDLPTPGFVLVFVFVAYLAWQFCVEGAIQAKTQTSRQALGENVDWRDVYFAQGSAKIGTSILGALTWVGVIYSSDWLLGQFGGISRPQLETCYILCELRRVLP